MPGPGHHKGVGCFKTLWVDGPDDDVYAEFVDGGWYGFFGTAGVLYSELLVAASPGQVWSVDFRPSSFSGFPSYVKGATPPGTATQFYQNPYYG